MLRYMVVVALATLIVAPLAEAQSKPIPSNPLQIQHIAAEHETVVNNAEDDLHQRLQHEMIAHVILERQSQLKRDTEKLLSLAEELKQHVDKTNTNILSMDVIKKAQEIQKLAKSVQNKMKNAY